MEDVSLTIARIKDKARAEYVPIVRDNTIEKIENLLEEGNYKTILEIGTAVGYSGLRMLTASQATLTTIEKDKLRAEEARKNFDECGLASRTDLRVGDAFEILSALCEEGKKFDFVFLDGAKGQYIKYLPLLKILLNGGGILFADNILLGGLLENESRVTHKNRSMVNNMKAFIQTLMDDKDFVTEIYKIDDGFSVSKLK